MCGTIKEKKKNKKQEKIENNEHLDRNKIVYTLNKISIFYDIYLWHTFDQFNFKFRLIYLKIMYFLNVTKRR